MKNESGSAAGDALYCWFVHSVEENFSEEQKAVMLAESMFRRIETAKKAKDSSEKVGNSGGGVL